MQLSSNQRKRSFHASIGALVFDANKRSLKWYVVSASQSIMSDSLEEELSLRKPGYEEIETELGVQKNILNYK